MLTTLEFFWWDINYYPRRRNYNCWGEVSSSAFNNKTDLEVERVTLENKLPASVWENKLFPHSLFYSLRVSEPELSASVIELETSVEPSN